MYKYKIFIQFCKADAPSFLEIEKQISDAVDYFNSRSLIAKNPKKITDVSFSTDGTTLAVDLESGVELPVPAKALRVLTTYLIDESKEDNLSSYISGKQLFKMRASLLKEKKEEMGIGDNSHGGSILDNLRLEIIRFVLNVDDLELLQNIKNELSK